MCVCVFSLWIIHGHMGYKVYLVGGRPTPLKHISHLGLLFPMQQKNKKKSKPTTRKSGCNSQKCGFEHGFTNKM